MLSADPPPAAEVAPAEGDADVIEVTASRAQGSLRIDRRTYEVRDTPHSEQKDAAQLLRGLPAVTVTPEGDILVLGGAITRLHVDGRPYLGDIRQYLRTLHGSDIARIEVVTNPSAQFSAEGTGGTINLVLRRRTKDGVSGHASLDETSYGYGSLETALDAKRGDWSFQLKASGNLGSQARRTYSTRREVGSGDAASPTISNERGDYAYDGTDGRLTAKASYALDAKTSLSAEITGGGGHDIEATTSHFEAVTSDFTPFVETSRLDSTASYLLGELALDHKGAREGETLGASVQFYTNPAVHDVTQARFSDGRAYRIELEKPAHGLEAKTDWKRPLATGQLLSLGGSWHVDATEQDYRFTSSDAATLGEDADDAYQARSRTLAGYATFQQGLGALTLSPGLRVEDNARRIASPGSATLYRGRTQLFPSLHASVKASSALQLTASYSQRIERAPLEYLRPYGARENAYTLFEGNPDLKDERTDAYEMGLQYRPGRIEASATLYMRQTHEVWSKNYALDATGTSVYSYANVGSRWNRGAQIDLTLPLLPRLKTHASLNLFDEDTPIADATGNLTRQERFRLSTNGTLEWTGPTREGTPGDEAQLEWSYTSAARDYQTRKAAWYDLTFAYTHSFAPKLSLSATFRYTGPVRERLVADELIQASSRKREPQFRLKLLKTF